MKSLWDKNQSQKFEKSDLDMRVYSSRLLGRNPSLVLHGGGNTSVKSKFVDIFNEEEEVLYIKGSGWDLISIEKEGFAPVKAQLFKKISTFR